MPQQRHAQRLMYLTLTVAAQHQVEGEVPPQDRRRAARRGLRGLPLTLAVCQCYDASRRPALRGHERAAAHGHGDFAVHRCVVGAASIAIHHAFVVGKRPLVLSREAWPPGVVGYSRPFGSGAVALRVLASGAGFFAQFFSRRPSPWPIEAQAVP